MADAVPLVVVVYPDLAVFPELQGTPDSLANQETADQPEVQDLPVLPELAVNAVAKENPERTERLELADLVDLADLRDPKGKPDYRDLPDLMVDREIKVQLVSLVSAASLERMEPKEGWVRMVCPERVARPVSQEKMVLPVTLVLADLRVSDPHQEVMEKVDMKAMVVLLVPLDLLVHLDLLD